MGTTGLEDYGTVVLLRLLAVASAWQERGLSFALLAHAERGERDALDLRSGLQAELRDAALRQARQRAQRYRRGPL